MEIYTTWSFIKTLVQSENTQLHHEDLTEFYRIRTVNGLLVYTVELYKLGISPVGIDQVQNDLDLTDFETNFKSSSNKAQNLNISISVGERNNKYIFDVLEEQTKILKNANYVINFSGYCKSLILSMDEGKHNIEKPISEVASLQINSNTKKIRLQEKSDNVFTFDLKLLNPTFTVYAGSKKHLHFTYFIDGETI